MPHVCELDEEVYIGEGKREKVYYILGKLDFSKLSLFLTIISVLYLTYLSFTSSDMKLIS
jgi:hypothetical protein